MSINVIKWALGAPILSGERFVLVILSYHASDDGLCWPSLRLIAHECGKSESSIIRIIKKLVCYGLIDKKNRPEDSGSYRSNTYQINLSIDFKNWAIPSPTIGEGFPYHRGGGSPTIGEGGSPTIGDTLPYNRGGGSPMVGESYIEPSYITVIESKDNDFKKSNCKKNGQFNGSEWPVRKGTGLCSKKDQPEKTKKTKNKVTPRNDFSPIEVPAWIDKQDWLDLLEHKKILKCPMSQNAQRRAVLTFESYRSQGVNIKEMINTMIISGWKGFGPPANKFTNKQGESQYDQKLRKRKEDSDFALRGLGIETDEQREELERTLKNGGSIINLFGE